MNTLIDPLTLPVRIYELMVPFSLWLMAEGFTDEDVTLALCAPMLITVTKCPFVAKRQDGWIDFVLTIRAVVYVMLGRRPG